VIIWEKEHHQKERKIKHPHIQSVDDVGSIHSTAERNIVQVADSENRRKCETRAGEIDIEPPMGIKHFIDNL
jgi:hypothetical protein